MIRLLQMLLLTASVIGFASAAEEEGNGRGWLSGMCCRRRRVGRHYIPNIDTDIVVRKAFSGERINEFKIELEHSYLLISIPKRAIDARYEESEIFNGDENIRIFFPASHSKLPLA